MNLVDELPKTSAAAQHEQLVVFISKDDPFAMRMVREYATLFLRLRGLDVDLAMRRLLYHFKLPKESQQIGRVIRAFAEAYFELHAQLRPFDASSQGSLMAFSPCFRSFGCAAFAPTSPDEHLSYGPGEHIDWPDCESVELVFFALVMLNGDLHNPENTEKMTRAQFVDNIHRSGAKVVLEEETLKDLYGHIQVDPIVFDNAAQLYVDAIRRVSCFGLHLPFRASLTDGNSLMLKSKSMPPPDCACGPSAGLSSQKTTTTPPQSSSRSAVRAAWAFSMCASRPQKVRYFSLLIILRSSPPRCL